MPLPLPSSIAEKIASARRAQTEGRVDEAAREAGQALEQARGRRLGGEVEVGELVLALEVCGDLRREAGDFEAAESLYHEALDRVNGSGEEEGWRETGIRARMMGSLAALYDLRDEGERAIPLYEEAIRLLGRAPGKDVEPVRHAALMRNNLAMIQKSLGKMEEAEHQYILALESLAEVSELRTEDGAAIYNNLGNLYYLVGHALRSLEMHQQALSIRRALFGERHPDVAQSHSNLGTAHYELRDYDQVKQHYETSMRIYEGHIREEPENYEIVSRNFADILRALGDQRRAAAVERRLTKVMRKVVADWQL